MAQAIHQLPHEKYIIRFIFLIITVTIVLNGLYRHPLYYKGVQLIQKTQKASNFVLDWFFMIITMTIDPLFVFVGVIAMVVLSHRKEKGFIMFIFIMFNTFWAALIKAYHCDPRPFWTSDKVKSIGIYCPIEYGNPSGHSWFSVILGFGVLMEYRGAGKRYVNILYSILMVIFVPMSRVYLGAHSLNQVLEGLIYGTCMCLLFRLGLKNIFHKFLSQFNHRKIWKFLIICLHILSIIPFMLHMQQQLPEKWLANISKKCIKDMNETRLNQLMFIVNSLIINVATGIGMGYEQLVKSPHGAYYLTGNWRVNKEKYGKSLAWVYYVLVEVSFMLSGLVGAGIFYKLYPSFAMGYIGISIGSIISGYMFTSRNIRFLNKYSIIVKYKPEDSKEEENKHFLDKTNKQLEQQKKFNKQRYENEKQK